MANPQKEAGYTPISNELLGAIYGTDFTATELKVLLFIFRFTYGFSRKECEISLTFISKGVGISKRYISSTVSKLVDDNVLVIVKEHTDTQSRVIRINKDYEEWKNHIIVQQMKQNSTGEAESITTDEAEFTTTDELQFYQDKQTLKQTLKQNNNIVDTADTLATAPKFLDDSFEILVVEAIIHSCLELYPNSKVPSTYKEKEKWAIEIERMKRIDNRTEEEIKLALQFAVKDTFWKSNIRSTKKFREKFETLLIQSKKGTNGNIGINKGQKIQDDFIDNMKGWLNDTAGVY